ncbi:hypothetical protein PAXINDRAFT_76611 [Paxillus involutus ATCC 200175]|uniref:Uncharacterized protein n=1 Tax=Paxillus involutus ATCC 200175 TaxID=664439 RepID=A0A0C9U960_PAXIN|nr:hypothetical protein PAXINDRAFT_76611 [Paxillus involutus ATCC 200175]
MSSISGTQSPPLEATGSHIPMGVSSIDGSCSKPMKDIEQRAGKAFQPNITAFTMMYSSHRIAYFSDAVRRGFCTCVVL